ncbi:hypothetical protein PoB_001928200 [Plakobranchus ocellatus]|uniref:Uncharacterized protein n=1 Tax=Plakobranchus ocellatus TaxID=259542 RepID=A0AAV3ZBX6_9GAST|nr:hypothetical protein PoB_001928200 [Plakobranchus ocellatus]
MANYLRMPGMLRAIRTLLLVPQRLDQAWDPSMSKTWRKRVLKTIYAYLTHSGKKTGAKKRLGDDVTEEWAGQGQTADGH